MHELDEQLYFNIDERAHTIDLSEIGRQYLSPEHPENFVIPFVIDATTNNKGNSSIEKGTKFFGQLIALYDFTDLTEMSATLSPL